MTRQEKTIKPRHTYTLPKGTVLTGPILAKFLDEHTQDCLRYNILDSYMDGQAPYLNRETPTQLIVRHDFAGYIVDMNSSYLVGNPVQYQASEGVNIDAILDAYRDQSIADLDSELAHDCAEYGRAYEIVFIDEDTNIQSAKLDVRSAIIIKDDTFAHNIMYAVVATPMLDSSGEKISGSFNVTVWDEISKRVYTLVGDQLTEDEEAIEFHYFNRVPIIEYSNNRRFLGDYESVITLIDAYNILQSDRVIDREKLVDAILAFYGATLTSEQRQDIKKGRTVSLPSDSKVEYVIKNINEADADVLRETIAKDIHKFSKTPDMSDESFAGNSSGVAINYKLLPFEENCKTKERNFESGLMNRFKLYNEFFVKKSIMSPVRIADVDAIFTRSLPKNDLETSQMINNLDGIVDKALLASQLSFVKDGEETVELARKEAEDSLGLDNYGTEDEATITEETTIENL